MCFFHIKIIIKNIRGIKFSGLLLVDLMEFIWDIGKFLRMLTEY